MSRADRYRAALDDLRAGRLDAAVRGLDALLRRDPRDAEALANRAVALGRMGRWEEAAADARKATVLAPSEASAWLLLARALLRTGGNGEAVEAAKRASSLGSAQARPVLVDALLSADRAQEALTVAREWSAANVPEAWSLLGAILDRLGREGEAAAAWARAASLPGGSAAWVLLGNLRLRRGEIAQAGNAFASAVRADPASASAWAGLGDALGAGADLERPDLLAAAWERREIDPPRLDRATRAYFAANIQGLAAALEDPSALSPATADAWLGDPLFARWASNVVTAHPQWEALLEALTRDVVARVARGERPPHSGLVALAKRCWNAEYPWDLPTVTAPADAWGLAASGLSGPLHARPDDPALVDLATSQFDDPARERSLAAALPELGETGDATSSVVREMYEENPYPRVVTVPRRPPAPFAVHLASVLGRPVDVPGARPLQVLVAGCGTGQHALIAATRASDVDVLGIDLSRASLGRAARIARDLGVANARFAHGDILALRPSDGPFDVVESVGVLHHLAEPASGVERLASVLVPGGWALIGVYSQLARGPVHRAQEELRDLRPDAAGLREARRRILALAPEHPGRAAAFSPDLYTASGARDLLFHPCEHHYRPSEVGALLEGAGLSFAGLQHTRPDARALYRERWPEDRSQDDLRRWDELEIDHPSLFVGMILAWARKGAEAGV